MIYLKRYLSVIFFFFTDMKNTNQDIKRKFKDIDEAGLKEATEIATLYLSASPSKRRKSMDILRG